MFELKYHTPFEWTEAVLADFNTFLQDHAAAEKKASGMAISMLSHYPDKRKLVKAMTDLALEELIHFKQVLKLLTERDTTLGDDKKDPYIKQIRALFRHGRDGFLMDRLLVGGEFWNFVRRLLRSITHQQSSLDHLVETERNGHRGF